MGILDILFSILNFVAPACAVSAIVTGVSPWIWRQKPLLNGFWRWWVNAMCCSGVLVAGLYFFGNDGKMLTYGLMLVVCATCQWVLARSRVQ